MRCHDKTCNHSASGSCGSALRGLQEHRGHRDGGNRRQRIQDGGHPVRADAHGGVHKSESFAIELYYTGLSPAETLSVTTTATIDGENYRPIELAPVKYYTSHSSEEEFYVIKGVIFPGGVGAIKMEVGLDTGSCTIGIKGTTQ